MEATSYQEIPTDGKAVLGMTDFYLVAPTPTNQKGPLYTRGPFYGGTKEAPYNIVNLSAFNFLSVW